MTTATPTVHRFPVGDPIELSARLGHGALTVVARDDLDEAVVELTPGAGSTDLVDRITVELRGSTLVVHAPRQGGLADLLSPWRPNWAGGVAAVITVPTGTPVKAVTHTGAVTVRGRVGATDIGTGTGHITVEHVTGDVLLRYGSAQAAVQHVTGSVVVRSGAGDVHLGDVGGDAVVGCGSGLVEIGTARGAVRVRSGSGGARLGAVYGDVEIASGSGEMSIGLPAGVTARLDATTGSGEVRTELPVEDQPATRGAAITVRARTGVGDIRVFRAAA